MADGAGHDSLPLLELDGAAAEAVLLEDAAVANAARSLRARAPVDYKVPAEVRFLISITTHPHAPVPLSLHLPWALQYPISLCAASPTAHRGT